MTIPENVTAPRQSTHPTSSEELVVSESVTPDDLRRLLESLREEDCVHSWRNFGPGGTVDELRRWENERRPTMLFFFHLKRGGTTRLVGASAVADRLAHDFPHAGFPVLGRCCILPEYRSQGFYRQILQFRMEYCKSEYGSGLNTIHIGAVNERISSAITNHGLPGWPRFIHLGEEELSVAGEIRKVGAYLLLVPEFLRRMQATLVDGDAPPCVVELRNALGRTESGNIRDLGRLVKETFEEAQRLGWFDERDSRDIEQLLLFCNSIPLVGFR
jgi:GNAT superfamily N-acetyltransferase